MDILVSNLLTESIFDSESRFEMRMSILRANERPINIGILLCSPGTPFSPLRPDGADRQTDGHGNSMTESAQLD